ncbi:MAG: SIS domain-containing protein [Bacteroidetes bacterium]|nr:SIS domain-containing protein [Bacteroidota bacterium]
MIDKRIKEIINNSIETKQLILQDNALIEKMQASVNEIVQVFQNDGKVLFCGNGGSAADAQHLAAELSGRFYIDRKPLFAEALHVNSSFVTATANDYTFEDVFARMIQAAGKEGDILIALSTSGNSPNILSAVLEANTRKMITIGFTGATGGKLQGMCDILLNVPSVDTPRIQEAHIMIGHIICELVEKELFG